ncbi:unnamed protein product [Polarella glacialis]|uniref:Peroxisomal membrane protein MPV17 n=1 Tax=Polarella glacialis TaxID=89957 RepID=A0A813DNS5_POLGL|nr:unnamed protein product [Polarella glacialis]
MIVRARRLMQHRPMLVNSVAGGAMTGLADATAQFIEYRFSEDGSAAHEPADPAGIADFPGKRTASMVAWGSVMGLFFPWWYGQLDRWFIRFLPKLVFHQFLVSPTFNCLFLCYVEAVRDPFDALPRMRSRVETDWLYLTMRSLPFWMSVNTMNLYFTPLPLRGVTMSCVSCGWTIYLSWLGHRRLGEKTEIE